MEKIDFGLSEIFGEGNNKLTATVTIKADVNGVVSIDGSDVAFVKPGEPYQIECGLGQHIIKVSSEKHPEISKEIIQDIETPGRNYLLVVDGLSSLLTKAEKSSTGFFAKLFGKSAPLNSLEELYEEAKELKKQGKTKEYIEKLKLAANAKNGDACYDLACYYDSPEVADVEEAQKWLKAGAKFGHLHCMSDYAVLLYSRGSYITAEKYCEKPANAGYLNSLAIKGMIASDVANKSGNSEEMIKAFQWLYLSIDPGPERKVKESLDKELLPIVELKLAYIYMLDLKGWELDSARAKPLLESAIQHASSSVSKNLIVGQANMLLKEGKKNGLWR